MSSPGGYDPKQIEQEIREFWDRGGWFAARSDENAEPIAESAGAGAGDSDFQSKIKNQKSRIRRPFCLMMPPPNVTGALHLGHSLYALHDVLTRWRRMQGYEALYMPGLDHAGIATQAVVEKRLKEEEGLTRNEIGREALVERIWKWKDEYGARITSQLKMLGVSADWSRARFTLDEQCVRAVYHTFFEFFKAGLIYRGERLVNWDAALQTAVADDEIEHQTVRTNLWHLRYPIIDNVGTGNVGTWERGKVGTESLPTPATTDARSSTPTFPRSHVPTLFERAASEDAKLGRDYLIVATTRPETMLGDTAVAVHPDDERYQHLIGKRVLLPLMNRPIPIIADPFLVKMGFGTGCVKVTPAHDPNDYECGKRNGLPMINILTKDGKINENGKGTAERHEGTEARRHEGESEPRAQASDLRSDARLFDYSGMKKEDARKKVVADLEALGLMDRIEPYETEVGHSDRSKTPIEPLLSEQWFMKMDKLAELAMEAVRDGRMQFFPERYAKTYLDWLGEKRDWCISRQLWWGHRIPVWTLRFRNWQDAGYVSKRAAHREHPQALWDLFQSAAWGLGEALENEWAQRCAGVLELQVCCRSERANGVMESLARTLAEEEVTDTALQMLGIDKVDADLRESVRNDLLDLTAQLKSIERDPDVLDTWFSSSLWPLATLGWPHSDQSRARKEAVASSADSRDNLTFDQSRARKEAVASSADSRDNLTFDQSRARKEAVASDTGRESSARRPVDTQSHATDSGNPPLAYFLTFHTYGTWLHGNEKGSVDRRQNAYGEEFIDDDAQREFREFHQLQREPVVLDERQRAVVHRTIEEVVAHRGWTLHALHVRTNHAHVVVAAPAAPERVLNDFKSYATRRMVEAGVLPVDTKTWSRHGSTRYLWNEEALRNAITYTMESQGEELAEAELRAGPDRGQPLPYGRGSDQGASPEPLPYGRGSDQDGSDRDFDFFYPTDVLCTGRGIISLWVARMAIMGLAFDKQGELNFRGRVPFSQVYINPTIQDGQGRTMSKSLGNGVDPLDIIELYGTDALRWTMAALAGDTQDIRIPVAYACPHCGELTPQSSVVPKGKFPNDVKQVACGQCKKPFATQWADAALKQQLGVAKESSERFEAGRNFVNKLWQAATGFIIPNLKDEAATGERRKVGTHDDLNQGRSGGSGEVTLSHVPTFPLGHVSVWDRWILARMNATVTAATNALEQYQFQRLCELLRDFFWSDFCDWYIEEAKVRLQDAAQAGGVRAIMREVLETSLRMLHPVIPFVTEAIWGRLHADATAVGMAPGTSADAALMIAPWPVKREGVGGDWEDAVGGVLQPVIRALRDSLASLNNSRSQAKQSALGKLPKALIRADAATAKLLNEQHATIARLGRCEPGGLEISERLTKPPESTSRILAGGIEIYVPVSGLMDLGAERVRLTKELAESTAALERLNAKLANDGFVAKAPAELITQERERQTTLGEKIASLHRNLSELGG